MREKNVDEATCVQESTNTEDMMDTCHELAIESMEDTSTLSSFDGSHHLASSSTCTGKADNDVKMSSNLPTVSNTPLISPIIIGNVHAASALSSVFHSQELPNNTTKAFLSASSLNSDLISSVIPIFLSSGTMLTMSPSTLYSNENSCGSIHEDVPTDTNDIQIMYKETQSKSMNSNIFDSSHSKPSLSSSDTIILTSESSNTACSLKNLTNEISLDANDKKLSLLPNISERSVSLDSIPSLTLFKPDAERGIYSEESTKGVAVIGSDKFPPWLIQLIKKHNNLVVPGNSNEYSSSSKNISAEPTSQLGTDEHSNARSLNVDKNEEGAMMNSDETPEIKLGSLNHSDTVILSTNESASAKKSNDEPGLEETNGPFEKMSSGVSFGSVSTLSADPTELVDEQNDQDSLISKHVSETPGSITNLLNGNISQILYPIKIASDPLRFNLFNTHETSPSNLSHLTSGCVDQSIPQSFGNGSVLMVCNNILPSPRLAEAKETQTDLVLGTNTVYFKAVENLQGSSHCEEGQIPTTLLAMTDSTSATFCDTGQTLQFAQPKFVLPTDPQMPTPFISPTSTAAVAQHSIEFIATAALNEASQEIIPNSSNSESNKQPCPFKCVVCDESFSSKDELLAHRKSHKTFKCDLCNATFSRMGNYTRHRKIHNLHAEVKFSLISNKQKALLVFFLFFSPHLFPPCPPPPLPLLSSQLCILCINKY